MTAYLDDILIFSKTLEEHMEHLKLVLNRIIAAGLKLNPEKCKFIQQEVEYLGHVITPTGLKAAKRHLSSPRVSCPNLSVAIFGTGLIL